MGKEVKIAGTPVLARDDSTLLLDDESTDYLKLNLRYVITNAAGAAIEAIDERSIPLAIGKRLPLNSLSRNHYLHPDTAVVSGKVKTYSDSPAPYISISFSIYNPKPEKP